MGYLCEKQFYANRCLVSDFLRRRVYREEEVFDGRPTPLAASL